MCLETGSLASSLQSLYSPSGQGLVHALVTVWFGLSVCRTISHLREGTRSAASLNPPGEVSRGDVRRLVEA